LFGKSGKYYVFCLFPAEAAPKLKFPDTKQYTGFLSGGEHLPGQAAAASPA
jgi:hypothetical protein